MCINSNLFVYLFVKLIIFKKTSPEKENKFLVYNCAVSGNVIFIIIIITIGYLNEWTIEALFKALSLH